MPDSPLLLELVLVFGAALAVITLCHRLRIPAVVGFLLAGVLIGPYGLELIPDTSHVEAFAELAVALMLEKAVAGSSAEVPVAFLQDSPAGPGGNGVNQLTTEPRRIA